MNVRQIMPSLSSAAGNDVKLYGNSLVSSARLLLETGVDPNAKDSLESDTALVHVRHLLRRGLFSEAAEVAAAMLASGAAANSVNAANREEPFFSL